MIGIRPRKILILESDIGMAMLIQDMVRTIGHTVVGPVARLDQALPFALEAEVDLAVLAIGSDGSSVYSAADVLRIRGVPIVFIAPHSGYEIPQRFQSCAVVSKPFAHETLEEVLRKQIMGQ